MNWCLQRFVPSAYDIQDNHPYLGGISLSKHAENGTLYAVDLTDVAIGSQTVSLYNFITGNAMHMYKSGVTIYCNMS